MPTKPILKKTYTKAEPKKGVTRIGTIVSMRHRFHQFINEPFDIVHPNQPFGYINAKYRPCVVIGQTKTHVVVAPIKSTRNHPRWLEVKYGGFILDETVIEKSGLNARSDGMAIGCGELRQIPKDAFTYDRIMGHLPKATFEEYKTQLTKYMNTRADSTHPLQYQFDMDQPDNLDFLNCSAIVYRQDPLYAKFLHPNDPLVKAAKAQYKVNRFKQTKTMSDLTEAEHQTFLKLQQERHRLMKESRTPNTLPPGELAEHFEAIRHGYGSNPHQKRHKSYLKRR